MWLWELSPKDKADCFLAGALGEMTSMCLIFPDLSWEVGRAEPSTPGFWEEPASQKLVHAKTAQYMPSSEAGVGGEKGVGGQVALFVPVLALSCLASSFSLLSLSAVCRLEC